MLPSPVSTVVFQQIEDGAVLFSPATEVYFGLNEVGAKIWKLLPPATSTLEELCGQLAADYPQVGMDVLRADVEELLSQLFAAGLAVSASAGALGHHARSGS